MLTLLQGGDRRTIGRYDQIAEMVSSDAKLFPKLIIGLWSAEALARMRAADAAEKGHTKASRVAPVVQR